MILVVKDVDGFSFVSVGYFVFGILGLILCMFMGCMIFIEDVLGDKLDGK